MHQQSYINDVLKRYEMSDFKAVDTLFDTHTRLCKSGMYNARTGVSSQATQGESSVHDANAVRLKKKKQSKIGTEAKVPYNE